MTTETTQRRALVLVADKPLKPFEAARYDAAQRATLTLAANMLECAAPNVMRAHKLVTAAIGAAPKDRGQPKAEAAAALERVMAELELVVGELRA